MAIVDPAGPVRSKFVSYITVVRWAETGGKQG